MKIDENIVEVHKQLDPSSCIPMSVELVLKLLRRVPPDYFELQRNWNNFAGGTFACFDGQSLHGLTFKHQFPVHGGRKFSEQMLKELFDTIDQELDEGRCVIISLAVGHNWHNFVIYDHAPNGEYLAVSKTLTDTWKRDDVKQKVTEMTGTDILTYEVADQCRP